MRIAINVLMYGGQMSGYTSATLVQDVAWCTREGHDITYQWLDMHAVDRARNRAIADARASESDLVYMIDADTAADPTRSVLAHLVQTLRAQQCEAVSAVVPLRYPMLGRVNADPARPFEVYEATKSGAALLLVDLRRLESLAPGHPWFRFVVGEDGVTVERSEDLYFVDEVRRLGGRVMADFTVPTIHLSPTPVEMVKLIAAQQRAQDPV